MTSIYFNNQRARQEQFLLEDLIIESIRNHGIDVYYIPRTSLSSIDELFGDDPVKYFNQAIKTEIYPESYKDWEGNKEFFSKFGLQIQETARICIARRTFERSITSRLPETHRTPKEGDLIYLPVHYKLMEIKFVEEEKNFFQLGRDSKNPYMYGISLETFKYNGELLKTGVSEIDRIANLEALSTKYIVNIGGSGEYEEFEWVYQGDSFENADIRAIVIDWNLATKSLYLRNIKGTFIPGEPIIGVNSGASWVFSDGGNTQINASNPDIYDNHRIEVESLNFLSFDENNPFGEINE